MPTTETLRPYIVARAGGSCEYCRLIEFATGMTFHVEHILPRSQGGETNLDNLALACPGCNLSKADHTHGEDLQGEIQALYSPRKYEPRYLGWHLHFTLDRRTGMVKATSATGEATVWRLQMNSLTRMFARQLQIRARLLT
jgi:hypothetical protein